MQMVSEDVMEDMISQAEDKREDDEKATVSANICEAELVPQIENWEGDVIVTDHLLLVVHLDAPPYFSATCS